MNTGITTWRRGDREAEAFTNVDGDSMIFIPCEDGLSHNELENATKADVIAGANVLLQAALSQAT
jgi:acetylornithine deacetylase/succinyl-diaminopimelate desuccinylase-like protein